MILSINSDYIFKQRQPIDHCYRDAFFSFRYELNFYVLRKVFVRVVLDSSYATIKQPKTVRFLTSQPEVVTLNSSQTFCHGGTKLMRISVIKLRVSLTLSASTTRVWHLEGIPAVSGLVRSVYVSPVLCGDAAKSEPCAVSCKVHLPLTSYFTPSFVIRRHK